MYYYSFSAHCVQTSFRGQPRECHKVVKADKAGPWLIMELH